MLIFWLSQRQYFTLRMQEKALYGCSVPPDSIETEPVSSTLETSLLAGLNIWLVLELYPACKCVSKSIPSSVDICPDRWVYGEGIKNYLKDKCLIDSQPTFLILYFLTIKMSLTSRARKPNHVESRNSLELIFANIRGLSSFFADSKSLLQ